MVEHTSDLSSIITGLAANTSYEVQVSLAGWLAGQLSVKCVSVAMSRWLDVSLFVCMSVFCLSAVLSLSFSLSLSLSLFDCLCLWTYLCLCVC